MGIRRERVGIRGERVGIRGERYRKEQKKRKEEGRVKNEEPDQYHRYHEGNRISEEDGFTISPEGNRQWRNEPSFARLIAEEPGERENGREGEDREKGTKVPHMLDKDQGPMEKYWSQETKGERKQEIKDERNRSWETEHRLEVESGWEGTKEGGVEEERKGVESVNRLSLNYLTQETYTIRVQFILKFMPFQENVKCLTLFFSIFLSYVYC